MDGVYQNNNYGTVDPSTNTNMNNPHVVTINKSGTQNAYITLRNYPGHTPKFNLMEEEVLLSQMVWIT